MEQSEHKTLLRHLQERTCSPGGAVALLVFVFEYLIFTMEPTFLVRLVADCGLAFIAAWVAYLLGKKVWVSMAYGSVCFVIWTFHIDWATLENLKLPKPSDLTYGRKHILPAHFPKLFSSASAPLEEPEHFKSSFAVPIIIDKTSGFPSAIDGSLPGGLPTFAFGNSKKESRQKLLSGIAQTGVGGWVGSRPMCSALPLVSQPTPNQEDAYCLELLEFAILREIQTPGSIGGYTCVEGGKSPKVWSGVGEPSPLSKPNKLPSPLVLRLFKSNRFAIAFSSATPEQSSYWFIPDGAQMSSHLIEPSGNDPGGREIIIDRPGAFHAAIRITRNNVTDGALPPGFEMQSGQISDISTRSYLVSLKYDFQKNTRGARRLGEYKKWLDMNYQSIKERYEDSAP